MSNLESVCEYFNFGIEILERTYDIYVPEEVLKLTKEAQDVLERTYRPLLDAYNVDEEITKPEYCCARDYRDTAITFLELAIEIMEFYGDEITQCDFTDVDAYIRKAVCYVGKAKDCIGCF